MASITPFVKRMRVQGGTLYTFSSANEDIGLNINERNVVVKMSHYVMLNIPELKIPRSIEENTFNIFGPSGALGSFSDSGSIKDGRVIVAESFQNYALNLETNLLSRQNYNPSLLGTVSERVFWKWLKETGAIRWTYNSSGYWTEEQMVRGVTDYQPVVMGWGEISGGAVRSNTFGTFNETYVLVPTSYGQGAVYWRQVEDDNYFHGLSIVDGAENIKGRENWLKPHPDGLEIKAYYDIDASTLKTGTVSPYSMKYKYPTTSSYVNGWWTDAQSIPFMVRSYYVDTPNYITSGNLNIDLKYTGPGTIEFRRSMVDCLSVEFNINRLRTFLSDPLLTVDAISIQDALDDSYNFNAVLLYYSVYNQALDKVLATNLLGVLFLDAAIGSVSAAETMEITIPSITKLQSGPSGFGTSYSFRVNIKSDSMLDDTQAVIVDESSSVTAHLENFTEVFDQLSRSLSILNQHTGTINFITNQYTEMQGTLTHVINELVSLEQNINTGGLNITGTENVVPIYLTGDDPLGDSSIYMQSGNVGIRTPNPVYPLEVKGDAKVMDLYIENAIRDASGNVLLGYGSPLQLGASSNERGVHVYVGGVDPMLKVEPSLGVTVEGNFIVSGDVSFGGNVYVANGFEFVSYLKETSLGTGFDWDHGLINVNIDLANYINDASLGAGFSWVGGLLYVDVSGGGDVSRTYVDASLLHRDVSILALFNDIERIDSSIDSLIGNQSYLNTLLLQQDVSISTLFNDIERIDSSIDSLFENRPWVGNLTVMGDASISGNMNVGNITSNNLNLRAGNDINIGGDGEFRINGIAAINGGRFSNLRIASITIVGNLSIQASNENVYNDKIIVVNSTSDVTIFISSNLTAGFQCTIFRKGAGEVTIDSSVASPATILSDGAKRRINVQYASASIIRSDVLGEVLLTGNLKTSTPPTVPNAPSNLIATPVSNNQINLSWQDNSNNEIGFKINRSPSGLIGTYSQIAIVGANVTTYQDMGLSPNTTYYYTVKAYNNDGDSLPSNVANGTTFSVINPPGVPTMFIAYNQGTRSWGASWNHVSGADGYTLQYSVDFGPLNIVEVGNNISYDSPDQYSSGQEIGVQVRAYNAGGSSAWSNFGLVIIMDDGGPV